MLALRELRDLLVVDVALVEGLVSAEDVAVALQHYWERRGTTSVSLALELARIAELPAERFAAVEAEVDRLIQQAGGNAKAALERRGGLDRAIHDALARTAPPVSGALARLGAPPRVPLRPVDAGRYAGFQRVGEGGMGVVFQAEDQVLRRPVAFKTIRTERASGSGGATPASPYALLPPPADTPARKAYEELTARFLQEAYITSGLDHPGVVAVHELGCTEQGVPYYTMRLIRGGRTLATAIDELAGCPVEDRLRLIEPFLKLCDTVAFAHAKGVVHRDLKPANVALGQHGEVLLLDWGIAKFEGADDLLASRWQEQVKALRKATDLRTMLGQGLGTPGYMSPEAAQANVDAVDRRSDVYSLGAILFKILTGTLPHAFRTYPELFGKLLRKEAPRADSVDPNVPQALSDVCAVALARDPAARPGGAGGLADAIRTWQAASAVEREVDGHLRDARAALDAAEASHADDRLRQVDRAAAALQQVEGKQSESPALTELRTRAAALRETGIRERERANGRRLLQRVGVAALAAAVAVALVVIGLVDAERSRADAERDAKALALAHILRLADIKKVRDLEDEAIGLRPLDADLLAQARAWEDRVVALQERLPGHSDALERLRGRAGTAEPPWPLVDDSLTWQHGVLQELVERLDALGDPRAPLPVWVARLRAAAGAAEDPRWPGAIRRIRENAHYGGLRIVPQPGLVPLGPDPSSGLEEFAYMGSGAMPMRGPDGELTYEADAAIVFVLLPGGRFSQGAQRKDSAQANYDPQARDEESPVHQVMLAPFLIAKHECTQGQWAALTRGETPSTFGYLEGSDRFPVELVSWKDCQRGLSEHGLSLPTEAQWEYACRATSTTPWWTGEDPDELAVAAWYGANADGRTHEVGTKAANPWGLHDVHGNVYEWCRDERQSYPAHPVLDPLVEGQGPCVVRGGSWPHSPWDARSALRDQFRPGTAFADVGVRPAKTVFRGSGPPQWIEGSLRVDRQPAPWDRSPPPRPGEEEVERWIARVRRCEVVGQDRGPDATFRSLDLGARFPGAFDCSVLALTTVYSEVRQPAALYFGGDDGARIWLNGKLVLDRPEVTVIALDGEAVLVEVEAGENEILVQSFQGPVSWGFSLRLTSPAGEALLPR